MRHTDPPVWQDGAAWRWSSDDGRFHSRPYPTKREAEAAWRAAEALLRPALSSRQQGARSGYAKRRGEA